MNGEAVLSSCPFSRQSLRKTGASMRERVKIVLTKNEESEVGEFHDFL
jgi:hypothetical protein